jgi:hypothetical protein
MLALLMCLRTNNVKYILAAALCLTFIDLRVFIHSRCRVTRDICRRFLFIAPAPGRRFISERETGCIHSLVPVQLLEEGHHLKAREEEEGVHGSE